MAVAFVKFRYITKDRDRHGNLRFYFRRPNKPKIRLRGLPGSEEFLEAYKSALGESGSCQKSVEKSFEWLCGCFFKSMEFQKLEPETRRRKRVVLDEICTMAGPSGRSLGSAPFASMKRAHVRKLRDLKTDRPAAADLRIKTISSLFGWAIQNELAAVNPAAKLERLGGRSEGFYTWTEDDVEAFEIYWPVGSKQRLAMSIMLYLGLRRSDAVLIGRKNESQDGRTVTFPVFKGRKKAVKILTLPILPPLRAVLNASKLGHETWLESSFGKPYSNAGFGNVFKDWCVEARLPQCNCHGLRKISAVRAAHAGATEHELMAMFGWDDPKMARVYTRKAEQKRMAANGASKVNHREITVPPAVPLEKKYMINNRIEDGWWTRQGLNL